MSDFLADINECMANNGGCDHHCENCPGSHRCSCLYGYSLGSDEQSCTGELSQFL